MIVPTAGLELLHVPPEVPFVYVTQEPWHTLVGPPMPSGALTTVTANVDRQPPCVYVITVLPVPAPAVAAPVTGLIVMIPAGNADQKPGAGALVYVVLAPVHRLGGPVIGDGFGFTVATTVE